MPLGKQKITSTGQKVYFFVCLVSMILYWKREKWKSEFPLPLFLWLENTMRIPLTISTLPHCFRTLYFLQLIASTIFLRIFTSVNNLIINLTISTLPLYISSNPINNLSQILYPSTNFFQTYFIILHILVRTKQENLEVKSNFHRKVGGFQLSTSNHHKSKQTNAPS